MSKWILLVAGGMGAVLAAAVWASQSGVGLPRPAKKPVSIREGSRTAGHTGKRYRYRRHLIGGGTFHGK